MESNEQPQLVSTPDAPDQETMEQIRRRRLAKLGGPPASATPGTGSPSTETQTSLGPASATTAEEKAATSESEKPTPSETRSKINITPAASTTPQAAGNAGSSRPGSNIDKESGAKRRASDIDGPSATPPPRKHTPAAQETIEDYGDRVLSSIFRVTLDPSRTTDSHGHKLTFLPNLSQELADEGAPLKLSAGRVEEAILEAATAWPADRPLLDYLLPCWKRVTRTLKALRGPAPEKEALLKEARRLCFSNCIFALTMPELFR
jgi:ubiquitin conjugation factor E4 B